VVLLHLRLSQVQILLGIRLFWLLKGTIFIVVVNIVIVVLLGVSGILHLIL